ncbi:hypothetical protein SynA1524_02111 [Synechococcus sp. A15-24]|nr:hypothetical protein SynA1524_02111 [Synechococcus sp. A15-24]
MLSQLQARLSARPIRPSGQEVCEEEDDTNGAYNLMER